MPVPRLRELRQNTGIPKRYRCLAGLSGALFLLLISIPAALAENRPRFGLWVESEGVNQPFKSRENFDEFLEFAGNWQFTDLYCQVYRGGRTWYPSMMGDDTPYREAAAQGFDPLGDTIAAAKKRGQKVHAWVNVLRLFQNPNAPLLKIIGNERAVQYDNFGNSVLEYDKDGNPPKGSGFGLGTYGIWIDPSDPAVRQYVIETVRDVILRYPELSGIHLDMIRYPDAIRTNWKTKLPYRPEFGFSPNSIRRFYEVSGRKPPEKIDAKLIRELSNSQSWSAWRRAQVTLFVFELREMVHEIAPHLEVSAAVFADVERARDGVMQDWVTWLQYRLIDTVVPMNYTPKSELFNRITNKVGKLVSKERLIMGIGAWMMTRSPNDMLAQANASLKAGASGVVLFSYSNLYSKQGRVALSHVESGLFSSNKHVVKDRVR